MKLFIPTIGTRLVLAEAWTFHLHDEYRNEKFYESFHGEIKRTNHHFSNYRGQSSPVQTNEFHYAVYDKPAPIETTLPKGSVIEVDRIYLRKGLSDFDSVTFRLISGKPKVKGRFWAKLDEVNNIIVDEAKKEVKWPHGRFVVTIHERHERTNRENCTCGYHIPAFVNRPAETPRECVCDQTQWAKEITQGLHWQTKPEGNRSRKGITVDHKTNTRGTIDQIRVENYYYCHASYDGSYRKDFQTVDELVIWAKNKNFTLDHVTKFVELYKQRLADLPVVEQED